MRYDILYLFGFSPRTTTKLYRLGELTAMQVSAGYSVAVALLHDAVVGVTPADHMAPGLRELVGLGAHVYVLRADLLARGLRPDSVTRAIRVVDYEDLIDMVVDCRALDCWM